MKSKTFPILLITLAVITIVVVFIWLRSYFSALTATDTNETGTQQTQTTTGETGGNPVGACTPTADVTGDGVINSADCPGAVSTTEGTTNGTTGTDAGSNSTSGSTSGTTSGTTSTPGGTDGTTNNTTGSTPSGTTNNDSTASTGQTAGTTNNNGATTGTKSPNAETAGVGFFSGLFNSTSASSPSVGVVWLVFILPLLLLDLLLLYLVWDTRRRVKGLETAKLEQSKPITEIEKDTSIVDNSASLPPAVTVPVTTTPSLAASPMAPLETETAPGALVPPNISASLSDSASPVTVPVQAPPPPIQLDPTAPVVPPQPPSAPTF